MGKQSAGFGKGPIRTLGVLPHRPDASRPANKNLLVVPSLVVIEKLAHVVLVDLFRVPGCKKKVSVLYGQSGRRNVVIGKYLPDPIPGVPVAPPPRVVGCLEGVRCEAVFP